MPIHAGSGRKDSLCSKACTESIRPRHDPAVRVSSTPSLGWNVDQCNQTVLETKDKNRCIVDIADTGRRRALVPFECQLHLDKAGDEDRRSLSFFTSLH